MHSKIAIFLFVIPLALTGCDKQNSPEYSSPSDTEKSSAGRKLTNLNPQNREKKIDRQARKRQPYKVIHVFVALCDNTHQGIVPVPETLGNGRDPRNNLYWGAMYGVKTYLKNQSGWTPIRVEPIGQKNQVLDNAAFVRKNVVVFAQAYDGAYMSSVVQDFFACAAGNYDCTFIAQPQEQKLELYAGSQSDMICFVGHNGLMDVNFQNTLTKSNQPRPDCAVVLACKSHPYFVPILNTLGCKPLVTTTGFMAPEAYTLEAILRAWMDGGDSAAVLDAAARAYAKYQKCSLSAARGLFVTGID